MPRKIPNLDTLRRRAAASASHRGHRFRWHQPYGRPAVPHLGATRENFAQRGTCIYCGAEALITQDPGQPGVSGDAVSTRCPSGSVKVTS